MLPRYKDIVELLKKGSTIEAQEQIMSLREGALELQEENQEFKNKIQKLEEKLKSIDAWTKEIGRYVLVSPWGGPAQAYALRKSESDGEQPHLLCANCFHSSKRVILNPTKKASWVIMVCPSCRSALDTGYRGIGPPTYAEDYSKEG